MTHKGKMIKQFEKKNINHTKKDTLKSNSFDVRQSVFFVYTYKFG